MIKIKLVINSLVVVFIISFVLLVAGADYCTADCSSDKGFENNMVVYGSLNNLSFDKEDTRKIIAYGRNGQNDCRGEAFIRPDGFFYLTIGGNVDNEVIYFKVIDGAGNKLDIGKVILFKADITMADVVF